MSTHDFDFLVGRWDVHHRRLLKPLTGSDEWDEFGGSWTVGRTYHDGAVSIDEIAIPARGFSGLSLRLQNAATGEWSIWWVNSRTGTLQPPVHGRWEDGSCRLIGNDFHEGRPILASYEWSDLTDDSARWQQAFSADGGETWETNWQMSFRRTSYEPVDDPGTHLTKVTGDFDFLRGRWTVRNRTLLGVDGEWREFESTVESRTHHAGSVSVDEYVLPGRRGLAFRTYDVARREWSIYWVDSRLGTLLPPVHGGFTDGVGDFYGEDEYEGQPIKVHYRWDGITAASARWQQAFSFDGGHTLQPNWIMEFARG